MIILRSEDERVIADDRWVLAWIASLICSAALALIGFELGMTRTRFIVEDPRMPALRGAVGHRPSFAPGVGTVVGTIVGATAGAALALMVMKERRRIRAVTVAWAVLGSTIAFVVVGIAALAFRRIAPPMFLSVAMIAGAATGTILTMRVDLALRSKRQSIEAIVADVMRVRPELPAWVASFVCAGVGTYVCLHVFGAADRWVETTINPAGGGFLDLRGILGAVGGALAGAVGGSVVGAWGVLRSVRGEPIGRARVVAAVAATVASWIAWLLISSRFSSSANQDAGLAWKLISAIEATIAVVILSRRTAKKRPPIARIVTRASR